MTLLDAKSLEAARQQLGWSVNDLWQSYFALGGMCSVAEVGHHLAGAGQLSDSQHDVLVHALNERFLDLDMNHPLEYSRP